MKALRKLAVVIVALGCVSVAQGDLITLTFDDIGGSGGVPNGYGGLNWSGVSYANSRELFPYSGFENGIVSGNYIAFGQRGTTITSDTPFDVVSVYLTSGLTHGLNVEMWADGVHTSLDVSFHYPTFFELDLIGITSLVIDASGSDYCASTKYGCQSYFVMDDLTVNTHQVPEPGTLALLGIGLFGMALARRRKV